MLPCMRKPKPIDPNLLQNVPALIEGLITTNPDVLPGTIQRAVFWKIRRLSGRKTRERIERAVCMETVAEYQQWRLATEKERNDVVMRMIYRKLPKDISDHHNALYVFGKVKQLEPDDDALLSTVTEQVNQLNAALSLKLGL